MLIGDGSSDETGGDRVDSGVVGPVEGNPVVGGGSLESALALAVAVFAVSVVIGLALLGRHRAGRAMEDEPDSG